MKNLNSLFLSFIMLSMMMVGFMPKADAQVIISEIMYNPPESGTDTLEYIELYNAGGSAVQLNQYSFSVAFTDTLPSFSLAAGQYYITCKDTARFRQVFGFSANRQWRKDTDGYTAKALNNNPGEPIVLKNSTGTIVDSVDYKNSSPWPEGDDAGEPDGGGASIVLCNTGGDNNDGANWDACTTATGKIVNGFEVKGNPKALGGCDASPVQTVRNRVSFVIFPNPAGNMIQLNMASVKTYEVNITDLFGKVVMTGQTAGLKSTLSVANLPNGMYLLQLIENNTIMGVQKLVISKQ